MSGARSAGYLRGRRTREAILDAAFSHFAAHGYHGASLRDMAAESGVSHPGLRHHFATKDELLLAVLQRREERSRARVSAQLERGESPRERILGVAAFNTAEPGLIQLFARLSVEAADPAHPAHEYFRARYERTRRIVASWLEEDGVARSRADSVATTLLATQDGLQVQWLLTPGSIDIRGRLSEVYDVLVEHARSSAD
ncbi:TetR/AcrR family transcriptional regulator [Microbacterium sp. SORGH_AS_0888]|uniref:TetR/AcrR family transcriptional regulator n=1 Tax=Microbacterium sp. SORGH_AS_0888 TaxID=3041791 RepID=UPI0027827D15|nr:TetR/AcrR family transcriptional regulator [Microbacterium sp. SORGH_AS_0888]MDQ1128953.1 AcrR family transcriptional regulator [Microbacterium sp. SORGH_AS_0888]